MSPLFTVITLSLLVAQFALPRRLAFLPLLVAVCHLPNQPLIGLGIYDFSIARLLLTAGIVRALSAGNLGASVRSAMDLPVVLWAVIALISTVAHEASANANPLSLRLSMVFDFVGTYLYARAFLPDGDSLIPFVKSLIASLAVLAAFMVVEQVTCRNPYAIVGAPEFPAVREGRVRAQGPFGHAILAGTVGASSLALIAVLWREHRRWVFVGLASCSLIFLSSSSSGPIMTAVAGLAAFCLWRLRAEIPLIRWLVLFGIVGLALVMKAPVWYIIARIDLTGSSTSWHRAALIDSAVRHLGEWWLLGTDYTRHWMPTGVSWNPDHTDITNHYLKMGVVGGLPLMISFIFIIVRAFQLLGRTMAELRENADTYEFVIWCLGVVLFAHTVTFISISYFDQTIILFAMLVGFVPGLCIRHGSEDEVTESQEWEANAPRSSDSPAS